MKTKEQYLQAIATLRSKGNLGALGLILTTVVALLVMSNGRWISHYVGRDVAIGCYFAVQIIVPLVALLLIWKLKSFAKEADLTCPACREALLKPRHNIKKILAANKCPSCGSVLYTK